VINVQVSRFANVQIFKAPGWELFVLLCSVRKLTIFILIAIYSCALLGPALWRSCRRLLSSGDEFVLVISKDTYQQLKHDENEMWWNGYLVDINSITVKKDVVELVVETDHFETNSISKHKIPKEQPTALWQWFNKVYTCDDDEVLMNKIEVSAGTSSNKNYPLAVAFLHVDCPPPDAA